MDFKWGRYFLFAALILSFVISGSFVKADEVEESMNAAKKYYEKGNYSEAVKELEFAIQLIRQKKSQRLIKVFPKPLSGWKADKPNFQTAGAAFFGGGISASREYRKGSASVTIEITMDNPLLQSFLGILDNPMLVGPDQKLVRVKGQRAVLRFDKDNMEGELNLAFQRKVLVSVKGYGVKSGDVLLEYAKRIDYDLLEKVVFE